MVHQDVVVALIVEVVPSEAWPLIANDSQVAFGLCEDGSVGSADFDCAVGESFDGVAAFFVAVVFATAGPSLEPATFGL